MENLVCFRYDPETPHIWEKVYHGDADKHVGRRRRLLSKIRENLLMESTVVRGEIERRERRLRAPFRRWFLDELEDFAAYMERHHAYSPTNILGWHS